MPNTTNLNNALMVFFKCHYCIAYVLYEYSYDVNPLEMYVTCVVYDFTRRLQRESTRCCSGTEFYSLDLDEYQL